MNPKKLEKIEKALGVETVRELEALNSEELKAKLVVAEQAIKGAIDELEANEEYQDLKESVKAMQAGMRDVKKRQNAIIQLSLHLMESKGD
jgi:DNA polymerase III delta prime subunit